MAFLDFMKKKKSLVDVSLDVPPEPPEMMGMDEIMEVPKTPMNPKSMAPIDEELMPTRSISGDYINSREELQEELPEFPSLIGEEAESGASEEGIPELPPLPKLEEEGFQQTKKKGLFSFLKPKKAAKDMEIPRIEEEFPEISSIPEEESLPKFPSFSSLPREREEPPRKPIVQPNAPISISTKPLKQAAVQSAEKDVDRFITIDDFKNILKGIGEIKKELDRINDSFAGEGGVKESGDKEHTGLHSSLKDIRTKMMFIDKILFKEEV